MTLAQIGQILCRPDDDEEAPSLLEKLVKKAELCANLRLLQIRKFKDSMISHHVSDGVPKRRTRDRPPAIRLEDTKVARPSTKLHKNNSFSEKSNAEGSSPLFPTDIKMALAAAQNTDECQSPTLFRRNRGMTEGADNLSINVLNANTHGMIKQKVGQL